jgi:hypothetical protein
VRTYLTLLGVSIIRLSRPSHPAAWHAEPNIEKRGPVKKSATLNGLHTSHQHHLKRHMKASPVYPNQQLLSISISNVYQYMYRVRFINPPVQYSTCMCVSCSPAGVCAHSLQCRAWQRGGQTGLRHEAELADTATILVLVRAVAWCLMLDCGSIIHRLWLPNNAQRWMYVCACMNRDRYYSFPTEK